MDSRMLLASPHMSDEGYELEYIHDAFRKNWIAPLGENVNEFEKAVGAYLGKGHPVALSAGTAALHLAMILAGVQPGDLVFCQSLTFSASANPVTYLGGKPVFIDSEGDTWNMDPAALKKAFELYGTPKAVVVVHLYGNPAKLEEITALCRAHNVPLIEDAAEALVLPMAARSAAPLASLAFCPSTATRSSPPPAAVCCCAGQTRRPSTP